MKPPPLLAGLALLFWGWQAGLPVVAVLLAAALEGSRWIRLRFEMGRREVQRAGALTALLLAAAAIYGFAGTDAAKATADLLRHGYNPDGIEGYKKITRALLEFVLWLPCALLPMALCRAYAAQGWIDLAPLLDRFPSLRAELSSRSVSDAIPLRHDGPYAGACLLAACGSESANAWFYPGLVVVLGYGLWPLRPRRFPGMAWGACFLVCAAVGYAAQAATLAAREAIQRLNQVLAERFSRMRPDADESRTAIGSIGSLKQSGRIVLRVWPDRGSPPVYLREASYNVFRGSTWLRAGAGLDPLPAGPDFTTWELNPSAAGRRRLNLSRTSVQGRAVLATPPGVARILGLPAAEVLTNRLGSVIAKEAPPLVACEFEYEPGRHRDGMPDTADLAVPEAEAPHLAQVVSELGGGNGPPSRRVEQVAELFARHFSYTLALSSKHQATPERTALGVFLLEARSGHCEYFATATVLLLRQLGIPARYATGYAIDERLGDYYVARQRHAHAWCLAWVDGAWRDLDTTPGSWLALEGEQAAIWEPLGDWFSTLWHGFLRWRTEGASLRPYLLGLSAILLGTATARLLWRSRLRRAGRSGGLLAQAGVQAGADSEFLGMQDRAGLRGFGPLAGEPAGSWVARVGPQLGDPEALLSEALRLHQRYRFDPEGLNRAERDRLRELGNALGRAGRDHSKVTPASFLSRSK